MKIFTKFLVIAISSVIVFALNQSHLVTPVYAALDCNAPGIVCKSGTLSSNEVWNSNNVYVLTGDVTVPIGIALTIEAGTVVKFNNSGRQLVVDGTLNVNGTSDNKVYFTSLHDDTVGGDSNGNGSSSSPTAGNWRRLHIRSNAVTITHAELRYAGDSGFQQNHAAIHIENASPTISNITVRSSDWAAISAKPSDQPIITNFVAYNTLYGGLEIRGDTLNSNATWNQTGITYILTGDVTVPTGTELTIEAGTVVKFNSSGRQLVVDGTLNVNGTSDNKVYFTSLHDDTVGGDSNGNGSSSSPTAGNWRRLHIRSNAVTITHAELRYAGDSGFQQNHAAIHIEDASPTISDCNIHDSDDYGIAIYATTQEANPTITSCKIYDNSIGVRSSGSGAHPIIRTSSLYNNEAYGVYNATTENWINAQGNWWGHPSGPKDVGTADGSNNPDGTGNEVNDFVDYANWLQAPPEEPGPCTGDVNNDQRVDIADIQLVAEAYRQNTYDLVGGDNLVTLADVMMVAAQFGKLCS